MSETDNVVEFQRAAEALDTGPGGVAKTLAEVDPDVLVNLMNFCARVEEGMQLFTAGLVAMESRIKRLELAHSKAERAKAGALLDARGERLK